MTPGSNSLTDVRENLSQADLERVGKLLADAADEFSQHSCNDLTCPATAQNKSLFTTIIKWQAEQDGTNADPILLDYVDKVRSKNEKIFTYDNWAMGYFAQRCKALGSCAEGAPELSPDELSLIAALFDLMVEYREIDRDDHGIEVDYTVNASSENKNFIAEVIKHERQAGWQQMVVDVGNSQEEIAVIDVLIMRYYSDRCKKLALPR
jgi:hypothetical protein